MLLPISLYIIAQKHITCFWGGWFFGLGYFGAGISWVHVSIANFGGVPFAVSILLMFILCAYLALFHATLFKLLDKYTAHDNWLFVLPLAWLIMEWLRANLLTGFPWLSIGYSQSNSLFSVWYPLIGEIGLSALLMFIAVAIYSGLKKKSGGLIVYPLVALTISSFILSQILNVNYSGESRKVALVQGNIEQSIRWEPEKDQAIIDTYLTLTEDFWDHDLIVWPEAAIPRVEPLAQDTLAHIDELTQKHNAGFVTGIVDYNLETDQAFNNVIALGSDASGNYQAYYYKHNRRFEKHHLLPIGEFVPFEKLLRPLAPIFDLPMSSFTRGDYIQNNLNVGRSMIATAICFEIAFPNQIIDNLNNTTDIILTVSNDAWFGNSHGPHQHLQIAQVRAKEMGIPVVRATNNGITAIIDANGTIQARLPQFEEGVLSSDVALSSGSTLYRQLGNLPIFIICGLLALLPLLQRKKVR